MIDGNAVRDILQDNPADVRAVIRQAYLTHHAGRSVNPPSYFLRFPDRPEDRIIALPASLGGGVDVDGIKWISSFPGNIARGVPRASAVLILNDQSTGYPIACMEASIISATRTAASAALAADALSRGRRRPRRVLFFGAGLISRYIHGQLRSSGWDFEQVNVFDASEEYAGAFATYLQTNGGAADTRVYRSAEAAIRESDLIVFATTAGKPHVHDRDWFAHAPVVLHISLRDLDPDIILSSNNIVDDVEHCLKADTSPHLAQQQQGHHDFIDGVLAEVLTDRLTLPPDRTVVFSPFGLGILDLALGKYVLDQAHRAGRATVLPQFFGELSRY